MTRKPHQMKKPKAKYRYCYKSAVTGKFISVAQWRARPKTSIRQKWLVKPRRRNLSR